MVHLMPTSILAESSKPFSWKNQLGFEKSFIKTKLTPKPKLDFDISLLTKSGFDKSFWLGRKFSFDKRFIKTGFFEWQAIFA